MKKKSNINNMDNLGGLGITIEGTVVSPNTTGSSYGDTVSEIVKNKKFEMGSLVKWVNGDKKEIVWMVMDGGYEGVVIHSDNLMSLGAVSNISIMNDILPFVGTVNIISKAKE
jgi:hypothetical protein